MVSFGRLEKDYNKAEETLGSLLFYRLILHTIYHFQKNLTNSEISRITDDIMETFKEENSDYISTIEELKK